MDAVEVLILGLIQGLTEFIPVSSSGHLVIAQHLFSGASDHLFLEFINVGTMLALITYFRTKIVGIIHDMVVNKKVALARNIIITSLPAGLAGYFFSDFIAQTAFFGSSLVVAVMLGLVGVVMVILERLPMASPHRSGETLSMGRAFAVGAAQLCAFVPGVSRSGSTIIAGRLAGLSSEAAAEYSFLASLPIMIGVTLKLLVDTGDRAYLADHLPVFLLSNIVAFVSGLLAIGFLLRYLSKHGLAAFGWYRILLAVCVSVLLAFGTMK